MSHLSAYSDQQVMEGLQELMYFLRNPHLDPVIWLSQESSLDANA